MGGQEDDASLAKHSHVSKGEFRKGTAQTTMTWTSDEDRPLQSIGYNG